MGIDPKRDPIVRVKTSLGAPTGEGTVYVTQSGREWRSDPSGAVVSGGQTGSLIGGGGKWGPTGVRMGG